MFLMKHCNQFQIIFRHRAAHLLFHKKQFHKAIISWRYVAVGLTLLVAGGSLTAICCSHYKVNGNVILDK